jgi:hypothetical protein
MNCSHGGRGRSNSRHRIAIVALLFVLPLSTGCAWLTDLVLVNTLDRKRCDTSSLSKDERVRKFEEEFLRERDLEAQMKANSGY